MFLFIYFQPSFTLKVSFEGLNDLPTVCHSIVPKMPQAIRYGVSSCMGQRLVSANSNVHPFGNIFYWQNSGKTEATETPSLRISITLIRMVPTAWQGLANERCELHFASFEITSKTWFVFILCRMVNQIAHIKLSYNSVSSKI